MTASARRGARTGARTARRAARTTGELHRRLQAHGVDVPVRLWDGTALGPDDAGYRLVLREPWSLRALLAGGVDDLQAGEAYLDDVVDVEGSMVAALRGIAALGEHDGLRGGLGERLGLGRLLLRLPRPPRRDDPRRARGRRRARSPRAARLKGRRHSKRRDSAAVRHHYDAGNDFYRLFLDEELVYSCAVFDDADAARAPGEREALDRAQRRKLDLVCRKLHLQEGEHLLDVGCGWGSLVLHAAQRYGVRATGVTLSPAQADLARERVARAGLSDRVRIEVADYRDLEGGYDAIASVGMVEHVGSERLDAYAAHLRGLLRPGGRLLNHGITTGRRNAIRDLALAEDTFVGRYVFPDGALVPAHTTIETIERTGLELWDVQQLRPHYARTLEHWTANLEAAADRARAVADDRTYRIWRAYMAGSVLGFESGDLGVVQVLAVRPPVELPAGRSWMEPDASPVRARRAGEPGADREPDRDGDRRTGHDSASDRSIAGGPGGPADTDRLSGSS